MGAEGINNRGEGKHYLVICNHGNNVFWLESASRRYFAIPTMITKEQQTNILELYHQNSHS